MRIKHIIHILACGEGDACVYTRTSDGRSVSFRVLPGMNMRAIPFVAAGGEWRKDYYTVYERITAAQYRRLEIRKWPYFGCTPEECWKQIKKELRKKQ